MILLLFFLNDNNLHFFKGLRIKSFLSLGLLFNCNLKFLKKLNAYLFKVILVN